LANTHTTTVATAIATAIAIAIVQMVVNAVGGAAVVLPDARHATATVMTEDDV
jgi:hypothetical protein